MIFINYQLTQNPILPVKQYFHRNTELHSL